MNNLMIKEEDLLENVSTRRQMMEKIEVLEKVKELVLLPNSELMTTRMVAEYYEVGYEAISTLYKRHKEELENNGAQNMKYKEISNRFKMNGLEITPKEYGISPRGSIVFSKRAVLNVGMLLRDSEIAQRVRKTLLDQQEQLTDEQKVYSINEEQLLLLNIIQSNNVEERATALAEYNDYKNRHINKLEEQIEVQKPMVEKYGVFINNDSTFTFTDFAKMISTRAKNEGIIMPMSSIKLTRLLRDKGVLSKEKTKSGFKNLPNKDYEQYFNVSSVEIGDSEKENTFLKTQTRVNVKGVEYLYEFVKENLSK